ncbi:MAG: hypothetical protein ACTSW1_15600 [Candidatus Hodarchaeales archaeon]
MSLEKLMRKESQNLATSKIINQDNDSGVIYIDKGQISKLTIRYEWVHRQLAGIYKKLDKIEKVVKEAEVDIEEIESLQDSIKQLDRDFIKFLENNRINKEILEKAKKYDDHLEKSRIRVRRSRENRRGVD